MTQSTSGGGTASIRDEIYCPLSSIHENQAHEYVATSDELDQFWHSPWAKAETPEGTLARPASVKRALDENTCDEAQQKPATAISSARNWYVHDHDPLEPTVPAVLQFHRLHLFSCRTRRRYERL